MSMVRKSSRSFPIDYSTVVQPGLNGCMVQVLLVRYLFISGSDLDAGPVVILVVGLSLIRLIRYQESDERKQE
jgi:hypothetical protein